MFDLGVFAEENLRHGVIEIRAAGSDEAFQNPCLAAGFGYDQIAEEGDARIGFIIVVRRNEQKMDGAVGDGIFGQVNEGAFGEESGVQGLEAVFAGAGVGVEVLFQKSRLFLKK